MLPEQTGVLTPEWEAQQMPSKTPYHAGEYFAGMTDGLAAIRQAAAAILQIERYDWLIYSFQYGIELKDLFGKPEDYVVPTLKSRIEEALTQDDRIESVDGFTFEREKNRLTASFTVHTRAGDFVLSKAIATA